MLGATSNLQEVFPSVVVDAVIGRQLYNSLKEIKQLKKEGLFIYGADLASVSKSYNTNFSGGVALVIGNEGKGLSRLIKEKCDDVVSIPMVGKVNSLNASVAAGILMYEVMTDRIQRKK